ncbi:MAG: hypothetical protein M3Q08_05480 [Pseudomonadota bacterium]|nr:hypothetical protein [Pseudomonadota bacterium]
MASEKKKPGDDQPVTRLEVASPDLDGRRGWLTPAMNKIKAGSAELTVGTRDDGVDLS